MQIQCQSGHTICCLPHCWSWRDGFPVDCSRNGQVFYFLAEYYQKMALLATLHLWCCHAGFNLTLPTYVTQDSSTASCRTGIQVGGCTYSCNSTAGPQKGHSDEARLTKAFSPIDNSSDTCYSNPMHRGCTSNGPPLRLNVCQIRL